MTPAAIARAVRIANEQQHRRVCTTCGERCAPFTCAWRSEVPKFSLSKDIQPGDVVVRHGRQWRVTATPLTDYGVRVEAVESNPAGRRRPQELRSFSTRWRVLRPGVCGARCCERHVREVGEGVAYCRAHWRAWMEVGAA